MRPTPLLARTLSRVAQWAIIARRDETGWHPHRVTRTQAAAVRRLVQAGLIEVPSSPADSTEVPYVLTDAGRRALAGDDPAPMISVQQREVLRLLAEGHTQESAARFLGITTRRVEHHVAAVRYMLGARNITHAVHLAHLAGLLAAPESPCHGSEEAQA
ncbi:hypothetical protein GCM10012275_38560 [Longimycelium tulufanense]|uniref:HTH luxR-type domain-containing protein n=1 Tax=Longimycelium tulufanense TaxID=907463 RepID=A0A8J3CER8_9PSEU|nr:helix-turn-helix transcriptional regulator [Longimycelium tulufanense]GGM64290.1 hypothetical protein GCM10012275_38560 [Longimycelium tulufanense]